MNTEYKLLWSHLPMKGKFIVVITGLLRDYPQRLWSEHILTKSPPGHIPSHPDIEMMHATYCLRLEACEKYSTSLVIREMQIKSTLRFYLIPVRIAKIKNSGAADACADVEKEEHFSIAGGIAS